MQTHPKRQADDRESIDAVYAALGAQEGVSPALAGMWRDWSDALVRLRTKIGGDMPDMPTLDELHDRVLGEVGEMAGAFPVAPQTREQYAEHASEMRDRLIKVRAHVAALEQALET